MVDKKKTSFGAIAVAAAIDTQGNVIAKVVEDGAIDRHGFVRFLGEVHDHTRGRRCVMLADNLAVHRTAEATDAAEKFNIDMVFNGTYSSEFNPIERLWAWSKVRFAKACSTDAPYHD